MRHAESIDGVAKIRDLPFGFLSFNVTVIEAFPRMQLPPAKVLEMVGLRRVDIGANEARADRHALPHPVLQLVKMRAIDLTRHTTVRLADRCRKTDDLAEHSERSLYASRRKGFFRLREHGFSACQLVYKPETYTVAAASAVRKAAEKTASTSVPNSAAITTAIRYGTTAKAS